MIGRSGLAFRSRHRLALLLLIGSALLPVLSAAQSGDRSIQASALTQIAALLAEKDARTPAEQKVDSQLLYAFKQRLGLSQHAAIATLQTNLVISATGVVVVDITAYVTDGLLANIQALGGRIISTYPQYRTVRAELPISQILALAGLDGVIFVQPEQHASSDREYAPLPFGDPVATIPGLRGAPLPTWMAPRSSTRPATIAATEGITLSVTQINRVEGDIAHRADQVRARYGYTGAGVKACVLSDGINSLAMLQDSGDLPAVTVVPNAAGNGDEGAAMLEIVHDLAPGAQLFYATALGGVASFAANIKTLRDTYGCDVIVDDVSYYVETPFQLGQAPSVVSTTNGGLVAQAVHEVVASGAFYFASAGNAGNKNDGTSGVWEGDFASAGSVGAPIASSGTLLDFDSGAAVQGYNVVTVASSRPVALFWSDPLGGSANDYDLFLLNASGSSVVDASTNVQNGSQDPYEITSVVPAANERIVVVQRPGAANRFLHLDTNRGQLAISTDGQTGRHAASPQAFSVAAADAQRPAVVFSGSTVVEPFSSDGLRRHFYTADSTPITPGNFLASGGALLQKPDLTAADGVSCAAPGFSPFYGTSAAAPHAAAIATLLKSAQPALTLTELRAILLGAPAAIDIEAPGADRDSGAGVIDALAAIEALGQMPVPLLSSSVQFREGPLRNTNGVVEPGETMAVTVALTNTTMALATNVNLSLELLHALPGVQVLSSAPITYGTLAANGGSANNSATPFLVSVAPSLACGTTLPFKLTANYAGGGNSPQALLANLTIGTPLLISTTLDTTAPPASSNTPAYTSSTGTQTGRLRPSGIASNCYMNTTNPGLDTAVGSRRYDAYTFTNAAASDVCVTLTIATSQNGAANSLFAVVYGAGGFLPTTPDQHYLADSGTEIDITNPRTFSFLASAGQSFTVVVHERDVGAGVGAGLGAYTITLNGAGFGVCAAPPAQPATIATAGGSNQSVLIGSLFTNQLRATVRDSFGNPVPGVGVTFGGPASGAGVIFPNGSIVITDSAGRASMVARANTTPGRYVVTANTSNGSLATTASFSLMNKYGSYLPLAIR